MNAAKWMAPNVPLVTLALKLSEEAAEVGTVITDHAGAHPQQAECMKADYLREMLTELDQVVFIANIMRERVRDLLL